MRALRSCGALSVLGGTLAPGILLAQGTTASLSGTVADSTGAVLPNAAVELKNEHSSDRRASKSNGSGLFSFSGVPSGDYDLSVTSPGFKSFEQTGIHLDPSDQKSVRTLKLSVGASSSVTVSSAAGRVETDTGGINSLITANEIKNLSVEWRNVTELFKTLPGFASNPSGGLPDNSTYDPSQVSVTGALGTYAADGSPINGVSLLSDGADISDPGNFGAALQTINYEQVAEVKVQTSSFTADSPRGPVVVNAIGKSGGDHFHGSLYTYARTSELDATDWLANYTGQLKPPDRQVYPGFTLDGPVLIPGTGFNKGRKLTFFVGAEDYAQRDAYAYGSASAATLTALVPTAAMRTGDFSAAQLQQYLGPNYQPIQNVDGSKGPGCNPSDPYANICYVPQTGPAGQALTNGNIGAYLDPGSLDIIHSLPLPNTPSNGTYNYVTTNLINNDLWQARGRIDDAISSNNHLFVIYSTERGKNGVPQSEYYSPRGSLGGVNTPGGGLLNDVNSELGSLNLTTVFTPTLTNEFYVAGSWLNQEFVAKDFAATQAGYPYNGVFNNGSHVLPALEDYGDDGLPLLLTPDFSNGGIYQKKWIRTAGDNVTKVVGPHTLETGFFFQMDTNNAVVPGVQTNGAVSLYYFGETYTDPVAGLVHDTGTVGSGSGGNFLANFLEGSVQSYSQSTIQPHQNVYFFNYSGFLQDHWRATQHLTVDLGLRIEHITPWGDAHNIGVPVFDAASYASGTNPAQPGFLWHAIDPRIPVTGRPTRWGYVEPRVGLAWDMYGTGKTILRAGAGIYRTHDGVGNAIVGYTTANVSGPIKLSSILQLQSALTSIPPFPRTQAKAPLTLLPASSDSEGQDVIADSYNPNAKNNNVENIALYPVWPFGLIGDSSPLLALERRTYDYRPYPVYPVTADWSFDPIQAARLGLGSEVGTTLIKLTETYQKFANGLANWGGGSGEFYIEQVGVTATALQEALVQDYDGLIRIAPAIPPGWNFAGTVFVRGGTKVDVQTNAGIVTTVVIEAGTTERLRLRNPWPGNQFNIKDSESGALPVNNDASQEVSFRAEAHHDYVVTRSGGAVPKLRFAPMTGEPAQAARSLGSSEIGLRPQPSQ